ncbi:CCC motif membrane protein [Pedobacter frigiditerrae]|uniref:CCC motif membrane protein n=1 Tax=Pedobacter frigiditerrae TaxID=2530452 RepID=UPI00292F2DF9|nr:CCC motif membrane protein [Pedobacter frigiditerrae]
MSEEQLEPQETPQPIQPPTPPQNNPFPQGGGFNGMQQNLPNATISLILGILSIPGCCCYGILGLILGIVAWVLGAGEVKKFNLNPNAYTASSLKNAKAGKVCGIIGTVLGSIYLLIIIVMIAMFGFAAIQDPNFAKEFVENMK